MNNIAAATVAIFFASWTSNVVAEQNQSQRSSGVIHFTGSIVESPCTREVRQQQVAISCERNGQVRSRPLMLNNPDLQRLPYNLGTSQVRWLDQQRRQGIVTVSYR